MSVNRSRCTLLTMRGYMTSRDTAQCLRLEPEQDGETEMDEESQLFDVLKALHDMTCSKHPIL